MGDLEDWSVLEDSSSYPSSPPPRSPSDQSGFFWKRAEEATRRIIGQVQPTPVSEERRKAVIDYVQRLIRATLGCEVFPFGSVPLKTYLPDGDIDLTAFGGLNLEEALATDVCSVLEREYQNGAVQFVVKDIQFIRAEVKLVKCLVQNIVVDISFNQLGGLCTLCFLEKVHMHVQEIFFCDRMALGVARAKVDRRIGKDHLFKRSIILIKAWCYYESRILGAHHGLISTYALETLVLYIFHVFHSSLDGPLAVLYKFLDYFSKFDWDNYCISLNGPVRLSSLPETVVEKPENGGGDLLLTSDFLNDCLEKYSVPSRPFESNSRTFPSKHLNIVDPLRENNNLGRSVSKGNFYRIRSAFTYGARKLKRVLSRSEEDMAAELRKFFSNTLDRHGSGQRPDVQDLVPLLRYNGYRAVSPFSTKDFCQEGQSIYESECSGSSGGHDHQGSSDPSLSRLQGHTDLSVSEKRFVGDAKDLATIRIRRLDILDDPSRKQHPRHHQMSNGETPNGNKSMSVCHGDLSQEDTCLHADLTGDYESQLNSLQYGHWWFDYVQNGPLPPLSPPPVLSQFQSNNSWEVVRRALPFRQNVVSPINANGVVPRQVFFPMNPPILPGGGFGMEEMPKPRGTGTYFPNANHYRDRPFSPRGRSQHPTRSPRNNGRTMVFSEPNFLERSNRDRDQQFYAHQVSPKNGSHEVSQNLSPENTMFPDSNGSTHPPEKVVEFVSIGHLETGQSSPQSNKQPNLSMGSHRSPGSNRPKPIPGMHQDRVPSIKSYHLTDEDDFPPLSI